MDDDRDVSKRRWTYAAGVSALCVGLVVVVVALVVVGVREGMGNDVQDAVLWLNRRVRQGKSKRKEEQREGVALAPKEMQEVADSAEEIDLDALAVAISAREMAGVSFKDVATRLRDSLPHVKINNVQAKDVMKRALNLNGRGPKLEKMDRVQLVIGAEGCGKNSALKQLLLERLENGDERIMGGHVIFLDLYDLDDPKDMLSIMKKALNFDSEAPYANDLESLDGPRLRRLIGKLARITQEKDQKYTFVIENAHRLTQFLDRYRYQYQLYWDDRPTIEVDNDQEQPPQQPPQQQSSQHKSSEFKQAYKIASNWVLWLNDMAQDPNVHVVMLTHEGSATHQLTRLRELNQNRFPNTHVVPLYGDMDTMKQFCLQRMIENQPNSKLPRGSEEFASEIVARLGGLFRDYDLIFRSRDTRRNLRELMKHSREKFLPLLQVPKDTINPSKDVLNQKVVRLWRFCKKIDKFDEMPYDRAAEILTPALLTKLIDENIVHYSNFGQVSLLPRYKFIVHKKLAQDGPFVERMNYLAQKHVALVK